MAYCGPSYAVPSCASSPVVGFGSARFGYGGPFEGGVPSASLGVLSGVEPSCINQIPPAEVVIQPPPSVVTLPGPILSATGRPVKVGGHTPCAVSYGDYRRGSFGTLGSHFGGSLGHRGILGGRYGICLPPC